MPIADGLVRSRLSTDLTNLDEVIIAEPSPATRSGHAEFSTRLGEQPKVYVSPTFAELAASPSRQAPVRRGPATAWDAKTVFGSPCPLGDGAVRRRGE